MQGNYLKAETDSAPEEDWRTWFESTTGIHVKEKTLKPNVEVVKLPLYPKSPETISTKS